MKIRDLEVRDREEVFKMMRVFYDSEAVLYTAPDEILYKDIDDCLSDLPFIEGYVENQNAISVYKKRGYKKLGYFIMSKEV